VQIYIVLVQISVQINSSSILADYKPDPDELYITMGCVEGDPKCPPAYHEFVGSKAPWYELCDDLPKYDTSS
jgi:hypothetical protein